MKAFRSIHVVALLASTLLLSTAGAASRAEVQEKLDEAMSHDGLGKIKLKGVDLAYVLPGVPLATYTQVKLDPVEVAFHKDWDPTRTGSRLKISSQDRENIRSRVAKIVYDEFVKELQTKSTYKVVDAAGPDVLRVKASIVNLYVNAPDTMEAGRSRSYTMSAGEMTLVAELYDSESGQVVARAIDRTEGRDTGVMMLSSSVFNEAEARDAAARWARILRSRLDAAHGIGKK